MTNVDLPNLAAKICFIALKAEVDKLDIEETVNVPSYLNNLKTIVVGLDVDKLETLPIDFKKASNVVNRKVVKKTKYNKLISKVHDLEDKIYDASTLIHINQYNMDKQGLEKNTESEQLFVWCN